MKKSLFLFLVAISVGLSFSASAASYCGVDNAKVVQVQQWRDGNIFIYFDTNTDCACSKPGRLAFHKDDDEKFFISAALTAYTTGVDVKVEGYNDGCQIDGSTARLVNFILK